VKLDFSIEGLEGLAAIGTQYGARTWRKTLATALTRTASHLREVQRSEMVRTLDRPTPYSLRGIQMIGANGKPGGASADALAVDVRIADDDSNTTSGRPSVRWLWWQVNGGANRQLKGFERALQTAGLMPRGWYAVPGAAARLDAYGNISPGQIVQILSQLRTGSERGSLRHMARGDDRKAKSSRRRAKGRAGGEFVNIPQKTKGLKQPGVYLLKGRDFGARIGYGRSRELVPVLIYVRSVAYARRFDFFGTARSVIGYTLPDQIDRAIQETHVRLGKGTT
jgi:hypothetical protein